MAAEDGEGEPAARASSAEAVVAAGRRAGKSPREIAVDLYGREQVDADWHTDSAMRSKLRRLACRAREAELRRGAGDGLPRRR